MEHTTAFEGLNETSHTNATVGYRERYVSLVFTFLAVPWLSYVTIAMTYYNYTHKIFACPGQSSMASRKKANTGAKVVNTVLMVACWFGLVYIVAELLLVSLPPPPGFCPIYHRIKQISYGVCLVCVYLTLWFRVFTAFYWDKFSKNSTSVFARAANIFAIVFLLLITVANYATFLSGPAYATQVYGCSPSIPTKADRMKWVILGATTIICQLIMLSSLIYPLYLHHNKMLSQGFNTQSAIPLIKRSVAMTIVCIISDAITSIFATMYKNPSVYLNHVVFSINLLVNMTCVICSFADHRQKLFPFPCCSGYHTVRRLSRSSIQSRHSLTTFKRGRGSSVTTVVQ